MPGPDYHAWTHDPLGTDPLSVLYVIKVLSDTTTLTTGDGKFIYTFTADDRVDGLHLIRVSTAITTVSSSGIPTFQIRNITDSVDVLTTKSTIDASEYTSDTAATPAVINASNDAVATGDRWAVDCDVAGTGAKGLIVKWTFGARES